MARSAGIDALRVFAMLSVMSGHMWSTRGASWLFEPGKLWHVPLYFFLAGFFWRPGRTLAREIRLRAGTLLLPCVVWLVLLGGPYIAYKGISGEGLWAAAEPLVLLGSYLTGALSLRSGSYPYSSSSPSFSEL